MHTAGTVLPSLSLNTRRPTMSVMHNRGTVSSARHCCSGISFVMLSPSIFSNNEKVTTKNPNKDQSNTINVTHCDVHVVAIMVCEIASQKSAIIAVLCNDVQ